MLPTQTERITIGLAILAALAIADLYRHGRRATRWREYLFLLAAVGMAMAYGALNDQITSRMSWEYFYYGKELAPILGPTTPPDPASLHWQAALIGAKATWTAGLLIGVAMLIANNPRQRDPQLPYRELLRLTAAVVLCAVVSSVLLGWAGYAGWLNRVSSDFTSMVSDDLWRPRQFIAVWGVHLGAYVGGAIGTGIACAVIHRRRWRGV